LSNIGKEDFISLAIDMQIPKSKAIVLFNILHQIEIEKKEPEGILSYPILSYPILSYPILSYSILIFLTVTWSSFET